MSLYTEKIGRYSVSYFNKIEFRNLKQEIFKEEIYSINLGKKDKKVLSVIIKMKRNQL